MYRAVVSGLLVGGLLLLSLSGCDDDKSASAPAAKPSAKPAATVAAPAPKPLPKPLPDRSDCPDGSKGPGTVDKPCVASGDARTMEVTWNGKVDDKGPHFRVVNTAKEPILFGRLHVWYYDKAGKQLTPKPTVCSGNIFAGVMKPKDSFVITFSCVKKSDVPDGAKVIQAEISKVGFTDDAGEKNVFFWYNPDLEKDARPEEKGKKKK